MTRPNGGASVLRTGGRPRRSFLPLRALRAADRVLVAGRRPSDLGKLLGPVISFPCYFTFVGVTRLTADA